MLAHSLLVVTTALAAASAIAASPPVLSLSVRVDVDGCMAANETGCAAIAPLELGCEAVDAPDAPLCAGDDDVVGIVQITYEGPAGFLDDDTGERRPRAVVRHVLHAGEEATIGSARPGDAPLAVVTDALEVKLADDAGIVQMADESAGVADCVVRFERVDDTGRSVRQKLTWLDETPAAVLQPDDATTCADACPTAVAARDLAGSCPDSGAEPSLGFAVVALVAGVRRQRAG